LSKEHHRAVRFRPTPHVIVDDPPVCLVPRVVNRRGFVLELSGSKPALERTLPAFFATVATLKSSRPLYPAIPETYARATRDGVEYLTRPTAKSLDWTPFHRKLLAQVAAFEKRYGALARNPANPVLVAVHANAAEAKALDPDFVSTIHGRPREGMLVIVLPFADDADTRGGIAATMAAVLHAQFFGGNAPEWHAAADAALARLEARSAMSLPSIAESCADDLPKSLRRLDEIAKLPSIDDAAAREAMVYLAAFRSGVNELGFKGYVLGLRSAADDPSIVAMALTMAPFTENLRVAVRDWLKSVKVVKGR